MPLTGESFVLVRQHEVLFWSKEKQIKSFQKKEKVQAQTNDGVKTMVVTKVVGSATWLHFSHVRHRMNCRQMAGSNQERCSHPQGAFEGGSPKSGESLQSGESLELSSDSEESLSPLDQGRVLGESLFDKKELWHIVDCV